MRPNLNNLSGEKEALSLLELNTRIRGALSRAFPETCWVRAERCAGEYFFRTLLSGVCGEECADRAIGGQGTRVYLGEDVSYVETLFRDGDRSDVRFRLESVGEGVC